MRAMLLDAPGRPLRAVELPMPVPGPGQVLVRVEACAVCRTDLHLVDGELPHPKLPVDPGPRDRGRGASRCGPGSSGSGPASGSASPGSATPAAAAGTACTRPENLCDAPGFTGYTIDGGYAEHAVADAAYCFPLPEPYGDVEAAPLLCAGLIGYRTLMHGRATRGGSGSTASGPRPTSWPRSPATRAGGLYAFTRPGDVAAQAFARGLGAAWAGESDEAAARAASTPP